MTVIRGSLPKKMDGLGLLPTSGAVYDSAATKRMFATVDMRENPLKFSGWLDRPRLSVSSFER